ncbi:hypothetical protein SLS60_004516 [Paraconiothyrium brasiliense]|uniref:Heterokaryon incompatibility domain-containing protein n=1 Tax=Paraconiothyrium brasiliense TaxID=300254 RepID=A0ABR3RKK5_9PLEO
MDLSGEASSRLHVQSMAYQHEPLNLSRAQIRLLRLFPPRGSTVTAQVAHFDFDEASPEYGPAYEAISYTWGEDVDGRTIQIAGRHLPVGDNLYRLLNILQHGGGGWLWIDQICIDQANPKERNHQVRMMHQIFTRALGVIAWLGDTADNSDIAMQCIADADDPNGYRAFPLLKATQAALVALVLRPYWSRLWILQEVIAAKTVQLMRGQKTVDWTYFETFFDFHHRFCVNYAPAFRNAHTIVRARSETEPRTLFTLLLRFTDRGCKDMRDKVYGLIGLVPYDVDLAIDYEKPIETVLFDVLRAIHGDPYHDHAFENFSYVSGLFYNLIEIALHLRRKLGVFSIEEEDLVKEILRKADPALLGEAGKLTQMEPESPVEFICERILRSSWIWDMQGDIETGGDRNRSETLPYDPTALIPALPRTDEPAQRRS